jgi:hypothetical protein
MVAESGELQVEAKPSDGKVEGVMPNSENNSTLDYLLEIISKLSRALKQNS